MPQTYIYVWINILLFIFSTHCRRLFFAADESHHTVMCLRCGWKNINGWVKAVWQHRNFEDKCYDALKAFWVESAKISLNECSGKKSDTFHFVLINGTKIPSQIFSSWFITIILNIRNSFPLFSLSISDSCFFSPLSFFL